MSHSRRGQDATPHTAARRRLNQRGVSELFEKCFWYFFYIFYAGWEFLVFFSEPLNMRFLYLSGDEIFLFLFFHNHRFVYRERLPWLSKYSAMFPNSFSKLAQAEELRCSSRQSLHYSCYCLPLLYTVYCGNGTQKTLPRCLLCSGFLWLD